MQVKLIRLNVFVKSRLRLGAIRLAALLVLSCQAGLSRGLDNISWAEKFYNPKPAEDDVVLPLPCGGAMAFRRVELESEQPLDDIQITVGSSSEAWGYAENPHNTYLSGTFSAAANARYFLIGKYEVSEIQYKSVTSDECPEVNMKGRLPQTRVGWFDAVDFSHRYSLWLRKHAIDLADLPSVDGESGFVRLPTEDEWEYVARGGAVMSPSDFRENTYPMPGGIARHEWYAGSASSNGKAQLTGLLDPNPLGVHDMLGNVDEISLELFRLNRLDRMHGQVGGYVVRGGNYFTPATDIRSSQRQESTFYKDGEQLRSKTTGFRVVVSAPVITSPAQLSRITTSWTKLGTEPIQVINDAVGDLDGKNFDDPVAELAAVAKVIEDEKIKQRITRLRDTMRATIEARNRQRNQAARESLRLGGVLCQKLKDDGRAIEGLTTVYKNCLDSRGKDHQLCAKFSAKLKDEEQVLSYNTAIYAESVMGTAQNYPEDVLRQQLDLLAGALKKREFEGLIQFATLYFNQTSAYASNWSVRSSDWFAQCEKD